MRRWITLCVALTACTGQIDDPPNTRMDLPPTTRPPVAGEEFVCRGEPVPGPNLVRRLTTDEYIQTVNQLLLIDVTSDAEEMIPPEPPADGFSNTAGALVVSLRHVQAYAALADTIVGRVDLGALIDRFGGCREADCVDDLIVAIAGRLYRAPLSSEEQSALSQVFASARDEGESFAASVGWTLRAALQSPRFLYRVEEEIGDGTVRDLQPHELASRLSYFLWGGPPDELLFAAAEAGELVTDAQVSAQVRRMLEDDRARAAARTFGSEWLRLGRLQVLTRDEERFPDWTVETGQAMSAETLAFLDRVLFDEGRPVGELFNAQFTVASPALAEHYGLPEPGEDGVIDLSGVPERGGLLTQGALHTIGGNESSMVMRGLFLLDTILCLDIASPPEGVDTTPPETEAGKSQRFYSEGRVANESCNGCHAQMEPPAWGLERFDAAGRYVSTDEHGNDLREDGLVRFRQREEPRTYDNVAELSSLLAESERVRECMSLKVSEFAMGRALLTSDGCALSQMRERFAASEGTFADLMTAIVLSPMFRTIGTETLTETEDAP